MKLKLGIVALGLLILLSTPVQSQLTGPDRPHTMAFVYNNLLFKYSIAAEDLKNTPTWNPDSDEPPISMRQALDVARTNLNRFVRGTEKFELNHINLELLTLDKWIFEVSFRCSNDGCFRNAPAGFIVFVKMDGSAIEPVIGPAPKAIP